MNKIQRAEYILEYNGKCDLDDCIDCQFVSKCLIRQLTEGEGITSKDRLNWALDYITEEIFLNEKTES